MGQLVTELVGVFNVKCVKCVSIMSKLVHQALLMKILKPLPLVLPDSAVLLARIVVRPVSWIAVSEVLFSQVSIIIKKFAVVHPFVRIQP